MVVKGNGEVNFLGFDFAVVVLEVWG